MSQVKWTKANLLTYNFFSIFCTENYPDRFKKKWHSVFETWCMVYRLEALCVTYVCYDELFFEV